VVNSYAKSLLLRANIEFSPTAKFKYTSRFQFGYTTGNKIDEGNTIFQAFQRPANYEVYYPDGSLVGYLSGRRNPLAVALLQVNLNQNYQGTLFNQIDYQILPSLKATTNVVLNYGETRTQGFLPKLLSSANPLTNAGSEGFSRTVNWQYQAFFNYNKTFGKDHSFTMDVSKNAKVSDLPGFITVDGQIVQATLVPSQPAVDARQLTTAQEKEALTKYMNYELGYYKKKLKQNYSQLQTEWITVKDRLFLVWYFDMPKDYKLVSRQLYFSTLFGGDVLDLNAPVFKTEQFSKARGVIMRLVNSLKTYEKHLDMEGLKKELSKG